MDYTILIFFFFTNFLDHGDWAEGWGVGETLSLQKNVR